MRALPWNFAGGTKASAKKETKMKKRAFVIPLAMFLLAALALVLPQQDRVRAQDYNEQPSGNDTQDNINFIRGRIISIDKDKNEIVVEEDIPHNQRAIEVTSERIASFRVGDHVKIWLEPGENKAKNIQKIRVWHPHPAP